MYMMCFTVNTTSSGIEVKTGTTTVHHTVPVLGLHQVNQGNRWFHFYLSNLYCIYISGGRLVVYGDSNCIDSAHIQSGMVHTMCHHVDTCHVYLHVHVHVIYLCLDL